MSGSPQSLSVLRLVNTADAPAARVRPSDDTSARDRFLRAVEGRVMAGGLLIPEDRRALMDHAARLGMRPFDASLVIAIVQDARRRGEEADPGLIPDRAARPSVDEPVRLAVVAIGMGVMLFAILVRLTIG